MADIFREVEEDLRREKYEKLWKRYGTAIIAVALAIIVLVGGYQAWRAYERSQREERSNAYAAALQEIEAGDRAAALESLGALSESGGGYGDLAALERARLLAESGDTQGAIAVWQRLAETAEGEGFRAVATLLWALYQIDEEDPEALRQRLRPLAEPGEPFRSSARELLAALAIREGDTAGARALYTQVADDIEAPSSVRQRAAQMILTLEE